MGEIKRFNHGVCEYPGGTFSEMNQESEGDYVLYCDHEAEIARAFDDAHCKVEAIYSAEVARLRAEVEAYRKDAERYQWLRDQPWRDNEELEPVIRLQLNALWDDKIDAAMGASA